MPTNKVTSFVLSSKIVGNQMYQLWNYNNMKSNVLSMKLHNMKKIQAQVKSLSQVQCENQQNMNLNFEMQKIKTKI